MTFQIEPNFAYGSRRSVVLAPHAAVASSQPLATSAGMEVLHAGGSAADAAIAVAAALQVTQPCSTGLGGDAFCLYYDSSTRKVSAYDGSGRSPAALTLDRALAAAEEGGGFAAGNPSRASRSLPAFHAHTVTVPGAPDAWVAVHGRFGKLGLAQVLAPAVRIARDGFSVEPMTSLWWGAGAERQLAGRRHGAELMLDGRGPRVGERFRNPGLAHVLEVLAAEGRDPFYTGQIAERIVEELEHEGGVMTLDDLASHRGEWVEPIRVRYNGYDVWECPPSGQGLAALLALQTYDLLRDAAGHDPVAALHAQVESMRLAFADAARYIADPAFAPAPLAQLLSRRYAETRASHVDPDRTMDPPSAGVPPQSVGDDTVYFCVVDAEGNGCSFINSNFQGFGTGIVPRGCGYTLQNRGRGFLLEEGHANALEPRKRPYHTIIPGLLTDASGGLAAVFGVMGGMMQPQGHLQVVAGMVDRALDPQSALDAPRFQLDNGRPDGAVLVEESLDESAVEGLRRRGHEVVSVDGVRRGAFGLGQIIATGADGMLWAGSDPRGDGHAAGF